MDYRGNFCKPCACCYPASTVGCYAT